MAAGCHVEPAFVSPGEVEVSGIDFEEVAVGSKAVEAPFAQFDGDAVVVGGDFV